MAAPGSMNARLQIVAAACLFLAGFTGLLIAVKHPRKSDPRPEQTIRRIGELQHALRDAVETYLMRTGKQPTTLEVLQLPGSRDPWGNDYVYRLELPNDLTRVTIYSKGRNGIDEHGFGDDLTDRHTASRESYPEFQEGSLFPWVAVVTVMALVLGGSAWLLKLTVGERMQTPVSAIGAIVIIASACLAGGATPAMISVILSGPFAVSILLLVKIGLAVVTGSPLGFISALVASALVGVAAFAVLCGVIPVWYRTHWPWTVTIGVVAALTWGASGYLLALLTVVLLTPATS